MSALDYFLLVLLPYLAVGIMLVGSIYRYRRHGFSVSSLSSEFLEGRRLFWGTQPFHWGLLFLFFGHLVAFLIPRGVMAWNSHPLRLLILEISAFGFGLAVLIGLGALVYRRMSNARIRTVTSTMDIVLLAVLLVQVVTGLFIAWAYRWGSSWFAAVLTPYLWSLLKLQPETAAVAAMPWMIKIHIAGAFSILLLIPFTRLMHLLVAPFPYLWRPYQVVIWPWNRKTIRDPELSVRRAVRPTDN